MKSNLLSKTNLPILDTTTAAPLDGHKTHCGGVRPSKRGKWRALSLILIHVLIALHIAHWLIKGRTITPVEPSEAMQTLELGYVNAGFILFALLILSTLIFGRFFCGWACHVVAYQDLCGWILKKLKLRPKPFRSRLLVFVPLLAAFYMFIWPQVARLWANREFPVLAWHLTTDSFWATFPGFWIGLLTFLTCGGLIVYFLGNKGFCTYACPYGAFFGAADRLAPGKILVTDACEQCGHCTATCTSNVRVHEEVKLYKKVVDPGCMKCLDCVSVCPKNALYFGFGRPTLLGRPVLSPERRGGKSTRPEGRSSRRYDFTWPEDIALAVVFLIALYAFRGLYDAIPFLFALGLSVISAYLLLQAARTLYAPALRLQNIQLRLGGKTTLAGKICLGVSILLAAFIAHSAFVQYQAREGDRYLAQAQHLFDTPGGAQKPETRAAAEQSLQHLLQSRRWGLFSSAALELKTGSTYLFLGNPRAAEQHLRQAVEQDRASTPANYRLAQALQAQERPGAAAAIYESILQRHPDDFNARLNFGLCLAQTGQLQRGEAETRRVVSQKSDFAPAYYNLGLILAAQNRRAEAIQAVRRAVELEPSFAPAREILRQMTAAP